MRIRVRSQFKYMVDNFTERTLEKGEYEVPRQVDKKVADQAIQFGNAVIIPDAPKKKVAKKVPKKKMAAKKAPENKVKKVKEKK